MQRIKLTHPDTGATCEVSPPAVAVLARSGWVRADEIPAEARRRGTAETAASAAPDPTTDEAFASEDPTASKADKPKNALRPQED